MRPVLNPALRLLWRDAATLQIGVDARHCVVLDGLTPYGETVLALLDGTRDWAGVVAAAAVLGVTHDETEALLKLLLDAGALDDAGTSAGLAGEARERLGPELAELSLLAFPGGGAEAIRARRRARVLVAGCGRLGSAVAALLAASGVGHVVLRDEHPAGPADAAPGRPAAEAGPPRVVGAARATEAVGGCQVDAAAHTPSPEDCASVDLVVLTGLHAAGDPRLLDALRQGGRPWLACGIRETCGVVGPLVLPGRSACTRCLDLARAERDAAWPALAAQLASADGRAPDGGGAALVSVVAGLACAEALAQLAGPTPPRCVDATVEVRLPEWSLRRRAWQPHPACGCVSTVGALAG